jgi:group I intron endonuclease
MSHRETLLGHSYDKLTILKSGIYMMVNKETGAVYVGSAREFKYRWNKHITEFLYKKHGNQRLQRVWEKYGNEKLMWIIVELCPIDQLLIQEQAWLDYIRGCDIETYNILLTANSRLGIKCSPETKRKMSEAAKARIMPPQTEEHKQHIAQALLGKHRSDSMKAKVSELKKGNKNTAGLKWVHTTTENKRVKPEELPAHLALGWVLGRLPLGAYKK